MIMVTLLVMRYELNVMHIINYDLSNVSYVNDLQDNGPVSLLGAVMYVSYSSLEANSFSINTAEK